MPTTDKPKRHYYRKLKTPEQKTLEDKAKVEALTKAGITQSEIMAITGKSRESIRLYQRDIQERKAPIHEFKEQLSDALHLDLLLGMQLKHKLLISLEEEDIASLHVNDRRQLINTLNTSNGISYDKIRLQDGKSTVNSSHRIQLESVHDTLYVEDQGKKQGQQARTTRGKARAIMETEGNSDTQPIDNIEITEE